MKQLVKKIYALMVLIVLLAIVGAATLAWYTSNQQVKTDTVSAKTGNKELMLQVSSSGGGSFRDEDPAEITQVNNTNMEFLMPVSTADLENFVTGVGSEYDPQTETEMVTNFVPVQEEAGYYHGRVYLRAVGEGWKDDTKLRLYLDQSEQLAFTPGADSKVLNAARLGLKFEGAAPVIFHPSENSNNTQVLNTKLNGTRLSAGQVLKSDGGSNVSAVSDPSVSLDTYTIQMDSSGMSVPQTPLLEMDLNTIYTLDIYFYLEGCDPDCSEEISRDDTNMQLAFYGVPTGGVTE